MPFDTSVNSGQAFVRYFLSLAPMPAQSLWMSDVEIDKCGYFSVVIEYSLPENSVLSSTHQERFFVASSSRMTGLRKQ
jgi:hypothetical protein